MAAKPVVETVSLDGPRPVALAEVTAEASAPAEVDNAVRRGRGRRRMRKSSGTKIQTQVPKEWRQRVLAMARAQGVRESDVIRNLVARALGMEEGE